MRFKRSLPKNDAELLTLTFRYCDVLKDHKLFEGREGKEPSIARLSETGHRFQSAIDAARNMDRVMVAIRKEIRKELCTLLQRIIHFLEAVADDHNLIELQQLGIEACKPRARKRTQQVSPTSA
jgi:hypothetical protein